MALELKQQLRLSQQLVMTPQLQQAIKLLQLSQLELVDMVQQELQENPVLEEVNDLDEERSAAEDRGNDEVPLETEGQWIFTARMPRPGLDPLFARALVNVTPDTREHDSTAANRDLMAELARIGGGRLLEGDPESWSVEVDRQGSRIIEYRRRAVWDRWWVMGLLLALLTVEWGLRRRWIGGDQKPSPRPARVEPHIS